MKVVKLKNENYLDSAYIVHNKSKLSVLINKILSRITVLEDGNHLKIYNVHVSDSKFDNVKQIADIKDGEFYCITNAPLTDGYFIQEGVSHTVLGMQYGNFEYGYQMSISCRGMKSRTKYNNVWSEWQVK